jgi:hypothetical protein
MVPLRGLGSVLLLALELGWLPKLEGFKGYLLLALWVQLSLKDQGQYLQ